ncbi:hypothetical protein AVEN_60604-1 [Araneus ventricosus]|uniref:Uncharacterized protein n=1 Tax=Araneus ventricosus TaxID=182803 RepID=A0A4Y2VFA8_ARAVE|nr:hypothetical protein AVEN_60604-1 [Araneus ventricosus]
MGPPKCLFAPVAVGDSVRLYPGAGPAISEAHQPNHLPHRIPWTTRPQGLSHDHRTLALLQSCSRPLNDSRYISSSTEAGILMTCPQAMARPFPKEVRTITGGGTNSPTIAIPSREVSSFLLIRQQLLRVYEVPTGAKESRINKIFNLHPFHHPFELDAPYKYSAEIFSLSAIYPSLV